MVLADELDDVLGGSRGFEPGRPGLGVVKAPGRRSSPLESRRRLRDLTGDACACGKHEDYPVESSLRPFSGVVNQGGGNQVGFIVPVSDEVTRRADGVDDVAGVLGEKEVQEVRRQVGSGKGDVVVSWLPGGFEELANTIADHPGRITLSTCVSMPPTSHAIGL